MSDTYIPALRYDFLTPIYDPLMRIFLRESTFKSRLIAQANISGKQKLVDVGCGSGTLAILLKQQYPTADVSGIDGDPKVLAIAQKKAEKANASVRFEERMSFSLPYKANSVDRVFSSLMFHHLTRKNKEKTFAEIYRVLKKGGELNIADWGKAHNPIMRGTFYFVQLLDSFETTTDNVNGLLPQMMKDAGFREVEETKRYSTVFGTLSLYTAKK